ncbi:MAG: hypothetical protein AAGD12_07040 [Pseudomonadota bacterium]
MPAVRAGPLADQRQSGALAARRHDLLAALALHGLAAGVSGHRLTLRLILLLTARYNWQTDRLAIGRDEIARLWQVDPRTVRREMARLRKLGWLEIRRAAARGRVAVYGLGLPRLLADLAPVWPKLGPDFAARGAALDAALGGGFPAAPSVPNPRNPPSPSTPGMTPGAAVLAGQAGAAARPVAWAGPVPMRLTDAAPWQAAQLWCEIRAHLAQQDPAAARVWLDPLDPALLPACTGSACTGSACTGPDIAGPKSTGPNSAGDEAAAQLVLTAPSAFVARYVETHFRDRILAATRHVLCAGAPRPEAPMLGTDALEAAPAGAAAPG